MRLFCPIFAQSRCGMHEVYAHTVPRRGGDRRGVKGWKFRPRPPITHRASSKSRRVNAAKASKYARVFSRKGHLKNSFACAPLPPRLYAKWEFALLVFLVPHRTKRFAVSGGVKRLKVKKWRHPIFPRFIFFSLFSSYSRKPLVKGYFFNFDRIFFFSFLGIPIS